MEEQGEIKQLPGEEEYHRAIDQLLKDDMETVETDFADAAKNGFLAADLWLYNLDDEDNEQRVKAEQAYRWLLEQDQNQAWVQNDLGFCCEKGIGCEENLEKAVEYYKKAAEKNHLPALINLAEKDHLPALIKVKDYYSQGDAKDLKKAFDYAQHAADLGDADSQYYVAQCLEVGRILDPTEKQPLSARGITRQIKEQEAIQPDLQEAFRYYKLAADQKHAEARYQLGKWYEEGRSKVVLPNQNEANLYFHLAAQQGHKEAQEKAAEVTNDKAYERNFSRVLENLKTPLDLKLTSGKKADDVQKNAQYWEALGESEFAGNLKAQAEKLRKEAKEPFIGVLATIKECKLHTFKWRFYQKQNGQEQPRQLETLEENLIAALCHSQGISGCEKNNDRAIEYYQKALQQARETGYSSTFFEAINWLAKRAGSTEQRVEAIPPPSVSPYEAIANTLLSELLSDYSEIRKVDRSEIPDPAKVKALNAKQAELEKIIPKLSQSLANYLEVPSEKNEQIFLAELNNASHSDLRNKTTVGEKVFNVLFSLTGVGAIIVLAHRAVTGHWGFGKKDNDFADKLDRLKQNAQQIVSENILLQDEKLPEPEIDHPATDQWKISGSNVESTLSATLSGDKDPYHGVPPPSDNPPLPSFSEAEQQSFKSDTLVGKKREWIGGHAPPSDLLPPIPKDNPPPPPPTDDQPPPHTPAGQTPFKLR